MEENTRYIVVVTTTSINLPGFGIWWERERERDREREKERERGVYISIVRASWT